MRLRTVTLGKGLHPLASAVALFRVTMFSGRGVPLQSHSMVSRHVSAQGAPLRFRWSCYRMQSFVLFAETLARFRICIKCNFFGLHQRLTALCVTIALLLVMIVPVTCSRRLYV